MPSRVGTRNQACTAAWKFRPRKGAAVAVLVRDPSATTPDDASLSNSRRFRICHDRPSNLTPLSGQKSIRE
jgi:hypothetical protein